MFQEGEINDGRLRGHARVAVRPVLMRPFVRVLLLSTFALVAACGDSVADRDGTGGSDSSGGSAASGGSAGSGGSDSPGSSGGSAGSAGSGGSAGVGGEGGSGAGGGGGEGGSGSHDPVNECADEALHDCSALETRVDIDEGYRCRCDFPYVDVGDGCRRVKVLVLDDLGEPGNSVLASLQARGFDAIEGPLYYEWDGLRPPAKELDVILSLEGYDYGYELTAGAQRTIQAHVSAGRGFVRTEWSQWEEADLDPKLMPVEYHDDYDDGSTWKATDPSHPLVRGMTLPFESEAGFSHIGVIGEGVAVLRNDRGYPIATYTREHGGTTVHLNHDVHYTTDPVEAEALKLYHNAVHFAAVRRGR